MTSNHESPIELLSPEVGQAIFGFLGVLVGAGVSLFGSWLQTQAAERVRKLEREERRAEAVESFQFQTLLELQLALQREGRANGRAHYENVSHYRKTGEPWGRQPLSKDLDDHLLVASTAVKLLTSRLRSEAVRSASEAAHYAATRLISSKSEQEAEERFAEFTMQLELAQDAIGEALRELPTPTVYRPIITTPFLRTDESPAQM